MSWKQIKRILKKYVWENQLTMGIIVFFLTESILSPLIAYYWPKPRILSDVAIYNYADITQTPSVKMKELNMLYYLGYNSSTLLLVNANDFKFLQKNTGVIGQYASFDFNKCQNCSYYSFVLKNNGNSKANKVEINIISTSEPEIPSDVITNSSITIECPRTYYNGYQCIITIENIDINGLVSFPIVFTQPSDITAIHCMVDDKYECQIDYVEILAQNINPKNELFMLDNKRVLFPTIENSRPNTLYYYSPSNDTRTSTWTSIAQIK